MKNVLIIGATSAIAEATARLYARDGGKLFLIARNEERLKTLANDLTIRGAASIDFHHMDINAIDQHPMVLDRAFETLGSIEIVLIAHGTLPDQAACENSVATTLAEINTNAISTLSLLTHIANKMETQQGGTIAVITSVAGERGRQSNYVYGAAKGMLSIFLQGLRHRLDKSAVQVLDIRPGFVDTPMTAQFKKGLLWAQPERIARDIVRGIEKRKYRIYTPFFWAFIMFIIRNIPEAIFKKTRL